MSLKTNTISEQIKESVCKFYLDNKTKCDFHYSCAESKNISNIYENISNQKTIYALFSQVSIVVLTANKYEKNILHHNIFYNQNKNQNKIKKIEITLFPKSETKEETYAYLFDWRDYSVLHIQAQKTGSYTIGGSADIVRYVIDNEYLHPMAIISLGICFGTNENKFQLGDTIISKKIYPYFIGSKISEKSYFVSDDNMFRVNSHLNANINSIFDENNFSKLESNVYFGNYITGEAVISQKKTRDEFSKITKQEIIAGEMEGYGLFKECNGSYYSIPCLVVKSICDWGVMKNFDTKSIFERLCDKDNYINEEEQKTLKDRLQAFASFQAFKALDILLYNHSFENSLYKRVSELISNEHGQLVYASHIKTLTQQIAEKHCYGMKITDPFIYVLIRNLIDNDIITCNINCERNINENIEQIWECTFLLNKGGK